MGDVPQATREQRSLEKFGAEMTLSFGADVSTVGSGGGKSQPPGPGVTGGLGLLFIICHPHFTP